MYPYIYIFTNMTLQYVTLHDITYIPTYKHTYIPTYLHTCTHAYIHTYIHPYIHTYLDNPCLRAAAALTENQKTSGLHVQQTIALLPTSCVSNIPFKLFSAYNKGLHDQTVKQHKFAWSDCVKCKSSHHQIAKQNFAWSCHLRTKFCLLKLRKSSVCMISACRTIFAQSNCKITRLHGGFHANGEQGCVFHTNYLL